MPSSVQRLIRADYEAVRDALGDELLALEGGTRLRYPTATILEGIPFATKVSVEEWVLVNSQNGNFVLLQRN
jgi:hypothetical protein